MAEYTLRWKLKYDCTNLLLKLNCLPNNDQGLQLKYEYIKTIDLS